MSNFSSLNVGDLIKAKITWMDSGKIKRRDVLFKVNHLTFVGGYTSHEARVLRSVKLREYWPEDSSNEIVTLFSKSGYKPGHSLLITSEDWPVYSRALGIAMQDGTIDLAVFAKVVPTKI